MEIQTKIHNIQIIAKYFNGFTNLSFRIVCNVSASIVGSYGLV